MADVDVRIKSQNEQWSEYTLDDGTILRVRPIVVAVARSEGQYTGDGDPLYSIKSQMIVDARVPQNLKRKPS